MNTDNQAASPCSRLGRHYTSSRSATWMSDNLAGTTPNDTATRSSRCSGQPHIDHERCTTSWAAAPTCRPTVPTGAHWRSWQPCCFRTSRCSPKPCRQASLPLGAVVAVLPEAAASTLNRRSRSRSPDIHRPWKWKSPTRHPKAGPPRQRLRRWLRRKRRCHPLQKTGV